MPSGLTIENLTITRQTNKITLSGTVTARTHSLTYDFTLRNTRTSGYGGRIYSYRCNTFPNEQTNIDNVRMSHNTNTTTLYSNTNAEGVYNGVIRLANGNNFYVGIYIELSGTGYFHVSVGDAVYTERSFCNMPYVRSLDVRPENVFEISHAPVPTFSSVSSHTPGWYRLAGWYGGVSYDSRTAYKNYFLSARFLQNLHFLPGYHGVSSTGADIYDVYEIDVGSDECLHTTSSNINYIYLSVKCFGRNTVAWTKFRLARGTDIIFKSALSGQTAQDQYRYHLYLEGYYNINIAASASGIYADNIVNGALFGITNSNSTPDGNSDILIGSEVTPTMIGTSVTIS